MQSHLNGLASSCILLEPGLPGLWISLLVNHHLRSRERCALFRSCKGLASLVVQHCDWLELRAAPCLKEDGKRREIVLGLASGCNNILLWVKKGAVLLDTPAIWPCITKITLCDLGMDRQTMSTLMLSRLQRLDTISLRGSSRIHLKSLDMGALDRLQSIIQTGSLLSLHTLKGDYKAVCKLAPLLSGQITRLVLRDAHQLTDFSFHWPVLQRVTIEWTSGDEMVVLSLLFSHPTLKHVTLPSSFLECGLRSAESPAWDTLEFTGNASASLLKYFPLQGVQQLRLPDGVWYDCLEECEGFTAALCKLSSSSTLVLPDDEWGDCCSMRSSVCGNLPTIALPFHPEILSRLYLICIPLSGVHGIILDGSCLGLVVYGQHLAVLAQLPATIHTVLCRNWSLCDGCSWTDVMASVPAHVKHLLIADCTLTKTCWAAVLDQPAPAGLRTLTLASNASHMCWVPWQGDELWDMQAVVSVKWPHVRLEVDNTHGDAYQQGNGSEDDSDAESETDDNDSDEDD